MDFVIQLVANGIIRLLHQIIDHSLQTHSSTIVWRIDSRDSVSLQFGNFRRKNHASTTSKNLDVACPFFLQQIVHVLEILVVAALVGSHRNGIDVFLDGRIHDFLHTSIVSQMNHLNSCRLDNSAHDVDGGIVAIKKGGGGHDSNFVYGNIRFYDFHWTSWIFYTLQFTIISNSY